MPPISTRRRPGCRLTLRDNDPVPAVEVRRDGGRSGCGRGLGRRAVRRLSVAGSPIEVAVDELMNDVATLGASLVVCARRRARGDQRGVPVVDRLCPRAPSRERACGADHAGRSGGEVRASRARPGRSSRCGAPSSRSRPRRRTSCSWVSVSSSSAPEEIDVLVERTEGWPAALVLAWLWLRTVEDPARAVRAFGGDHRFGRRLPEQ